MKKIFLLIISAVIFSATFAQSKSEKKFVNWHNKDLKSNKIFGVSTEKAYKELLKNKTSQPVIVAVIDGGTDINHVDLKANIWTNPGEIAGNGIDDYHNGYIDDIHGWNFIGNKKGENVDQDNFEVTRLFKILDAKYRDADPSKVTDKKEFNLYVKVKDTYNKKYDEALADTGLMKTGLKLKVR